VKLSLAFFIFIVVYLSPVFADEGYIPFFPDALEPDGIGFKGPASLRATNCWADHECILGLSSGGLRYLVRSENLNVEGVHKGNAFAAARSYTKSPPVSLEYNKTYVFKKLFYTQVFSDFGQTLTDSQLRTSFVNNNLYFDLQMNSDPFLKDFLTAEEKLILSSRSILPNSRLFNFNTESSFILFGAGLGLDLWFLEGSWGPFLMIHETSLKLSACKSVNFTTSNLDLDSMFFIPQICNRFPEQKINLDKQTYFGFALGSIMELSLVFLQTENWRVSMDTKKTNFNLYMDSNFKQVSFRGLDFYPAYSSSSTLNCNGGQYRYANDSWRDLDCRNSKGEDHRKSSDYTFGLKVTYYFRS